MPVTVTMDEWMRRMKDMQAMGGGFSFMGAFPDRYKVTVNGNHKLVQRMIAETDDAAKERLARQAFDLALLAQEMLTGADLTSFVERSVEMI